MDDMRKKLKLYIGILFLTVFCSALSTSVFAEEVPTLTVLVPRVEQPSFDSELITSAVNEYLSPLLGCQIDLIFTKFEQYSQAVNRYETTDQLPDVLFLWYESDVSRLIQEEKLTPLEKLLEEFAPDLLVTVNPEALEANTYDQHLYAVPTVHDQITATCFEYRTEIAEQYGLDMDQVKSYSDLTAIFEKLHQANPDIIPCDMILYKYYDPLGDSLGVLIHYADDPTVTNLYEDPEYENFVRTLHTWQEAGYLLDPDLGFDSSNRYVSSPEIFGKFSGYHPALTYVDSADAGESLDCVVLTDSFVTTSDMRGISYSISENCQQKELAARFLNYLYTDPTLINLLIYGIEGVHYQILDEENGVIGFPEGITRQNSSYYQFRGYHWGNEFLSYLWEGYPLDLWEQEEAANLQAQRSIAFGFSFSGESVASQIAACNRVVNDYTPLLENGLGDTEELLEDFRLALHQAGIDDIIAEKQRQLDRFLAEKEAK